MPAQRQPTDKLIGMVLAERYQILHRLGEGAMGVVYKARHVKVGRPFAVKVLNARALQDPKVSQRFEREAEHAGRLRHPNVVGVVDVGDVEGTRYMVMEFAEGPDLARLLDEAPMPPQRIIHLVRQLLEGLYHAHEQGLIHRDFKPENVIVERDAHGAEFPRIVDFGIALLRDGGDSADGLGRLTTNGLVLGTPHYMAPEQAVADPIDHRIDLFALGIVIYEMLSGRLPFDGNGAEVARANLLLDPPPISKRVPHLEVDPLLEAFSRRLMAKRRESRPATAKAAREILDLIERDRVAAARVLGVPVARSGRTPAATEPVDAGPPPVVDVASVTTRMKPTPGTSQPIAPAVSAVPEPVPPGTVAVDSAATPWATGAAPAGDAGDAMAEPPAMPAMPVMPAYASQLARPPAPGMPDRDTAMRTPLGWQAASRPVRRWPWLIGGVVVGAASIAVAAILALTGPSPDEPAAVDRTVGTAVASSPSTAVVPSAPVPAGTARVAGARPELPPSAPEAAPEAAPAANPDAPAEVEPAPSPSDSPVEVAAAPIAERKHREPSSDGRRPAGSPPRVRGKDPAAASRTASAALETSVAPVAPEPPPSRRAVEPTQGEPQAAAPAKPEIVRADRSPAPVGISSDDLGALYYAVGAEIRQLPTDEHGDLLGQLARIDILTEVRAKPARRDDIAGQLIQLRDEARRRKAAHRKP